MVVVHHRSMQRHGAGSRVPIRKRTCPNCHIVFKSKLGLLQHQGRKRNIGCYRAGVHRERADYVKKKMVYYSTWKKNQVPQVHKSVHEEWKRGKAFTKEIKQTCLNVYQYLRYIIHLFVFTFLCFSLQDNN